MKKIVLCMINWLGILSIAFVLFLFLDLYFVITEYKCFEYNDQEYYLDSNLTVNDSIIFDDNGEYCDYKNCSKVVVKINGWFPRKMLLYDFGDEKLIFDTKKLIWGIKHDGETDGIFEPQNISSVVVDAWDGNQSLSYEINDIEKIVGFINEMKDSSNIHICLENPPSGIPEGIIRVSLSGISDSVTYSVFDFSKTDKNIFLMSLTDKFGLRSCAYVEKDIEGFSVILPH